MSAFSKFMKLFSMAGGVRSKRDPVTGVIRIPGPDGRFTARKALLAGDSIAAYAEVYATATSITDNGDGTATVVRSSHSLGVGDPVRVVAAPTKSLCVMDSAVTQWVDANTFKIALGGRTNGVTSPSGPSIVYPLRRSCRGWFNWLETALGEQFDTTLCAVGGATASKISTLIDETDVPADIDIGFVCCGMNNIYAAGQTFLDAKAEIAALITKVRNKSAQIVVLSIPPRSSADSANWTADKQAIHTKLNRWLYSFVKSIGGIYIDTWRSVQNGETYVNAAATNPDATSGFQQDYTHPSMRGAMAIGYDIAAKISNQVGVRGYTAAHPAAIGVDTGNLLTGSDFATGTTVATGWASSDSTTNMTVTPSLAARTVAADGDACGRNQVLSVAYGTASGTASTRFRLNNFQGLLTAGTTVQFRIPFKVAGAVGLSSLELTLLGTRSDGSFLFVTGMNNDSNTAVVTGAFSGILITPPFEVPADLTDLDAWVRPHITSAQSSALTLTMWQPELVVLS